MSLSLNGSKKKLINLIKKILFVQSNYPGRLHYVIW